MNRQQTKSAAKYLYDISKIIFTFAVIGNLLAGNKFSLLILFWGIIGVSLSFIWAYLLDKKEGAIYE